MKKISFIHTIKQAECNCGVSGETLMLRAAEACYNNISLSGKTLVVCGSGNNGGDGYALAIIFKNKKIDFDVLVAVEPKTELSIKFYNECIKIGVNILTSDKVNYDNYEVIIDCIFGYGLRGEIDTKIVSIIDSVNSTSAKVISVDVPSGIFGDSGLGKAIVKSDLCVAIGALKPCNVMNMAKDCAKMTIVETIGMEMNADANLLENKDFISILRDRTNYSHKGSFGYVGIMGGSTSYSGAAKLSNLALSCLRSGAGVARLIVPDCIKNAVLPYLTVSTLALLPSASGSAKFDACSLDRALEGLSALAVGMGMTNSDETSKVVEHILNNYAIKLIIDADGINSLAGKVELLKKTRCKVVITPHVKEFSRITNKTVAEILDNPITSASEFANKYGCTVLLKGTASVIADGKNVFVVNRGTSGMAKGGSGDVLSGIVLGLLGYNEVNALTVACGAQIAGIAGELASESIGEIGMIPIDTLSNIAKAVSVIRESFVKCSK